MSCAWTGPCDPLTWTLDPGPSPVAPVPFAHCFPKTFSPVLPCVLFLLRLCLTRSQGISPGPSSYVAVRFPPSLIPAISITDSQRKTEQHPPTPGPGLVIPVTYGPPRPSSSAYTRRKPPRLIFEPFDEVSKPSQVVSYSNYIQYLQFEAFRTGFRFLGVFFRGRICSLSYKIPVRIQKRGTAAQIFPEFQTLRIA